MKDIRNYSLLKHNTFGIDARCRRFLDMSTVEEACETVRLLTDDDSPLLILGGGSNLLLTGDYDGTVLHSSIKGMEATCSDNGVLLRCGSGETWDDVVSHCVDNGWYGAENLSIIPGDVGASAVQNIGAYGVEIKDIIYKVEAVDILTGEICEIYRDDCGYAYRHSRFKDEWRNRYFITHVTYRLGNKFIPRLDYGNIRAELGRKGIVEPTAMQLRQIIIEIRNAKLPDPAVEGNAGSFFMNPVVSVEKYRELSEQYPEMPHYTVDDGHEKIPAGWMIDRCGWKGRSLGPAGVHGRQALVIVNRGGASGDDIVKLYRAIQHDVKEQFGIEIIPEVNIR